MSDDPFDEFLRGRAPRESERRVWLPGLDEAAEPLLFHDPESIADGMRQILSDDAMRARLVSRGRTRAACFSWEESVKRVLTIYRQVAA